MKKWREEKRRHRKRNKGIFLLHLILFEKKKIKIKSVHVMFMENRKKKGGKIRAVGKAVRSESWPWIGVLMLPLIWQQACAPILQWLLSEGGYGFLPIQNITPIKLLNSLSLQILSQSIFKTKPMVQFSSHFVTDFNLTWYKNEFTSM